MNEVPSLQGLHRAGIDTIAMAMIALELVKAEEAGTPHTLKSLHAAVKPLPYTSVSRIAWQFIDALGFGRQEYSAKDRRVRILRIDLKKFRKAVAV